MNISITTNPYDSAEGNCNWFPYSTELVNSNGCSILFWIGTADFNDPDVQAELQHALGIARDHRDIVCAYACHGAPDGYWAHMDM